MGPHTMLDEGLERCLDLIQETAAVNAVMPYSHGYNNIFFKALPDRADHGLPLTRKQFTRQHASIRSRGGNRNLKGIRGNESGKSEGVGRAIRELRLRQGASLPK